MGGIVEFIESNQFLVGMISGVLAGISFMAWLIWWVSEEVDISQVEITYADGSKYGKRK